MYIYFNFRTESYKYPEYQYLQIIYFFHQFERNQINYRYIKLKPYIIAIEKFFSSNPNIQDFIDNNKFQVSLRKKFHTYSLKARFPSLDTRGPLLETNIHISNGRRGGIDFNLHYLRRHEFSTNSAIPFGINRSLSKKCRQ